ncbi:helix-turn-helix domain-containing protein [Streptomyces sp. DSM 3412]|uniref:Helix-turn-helix domain-containing protein n=1 Tax=Streptomyces gottesmaniae TaxID=3075518 RepID=A0ABU2YU64_9ACTN|nr:helix-turn-helix domain-containing protein [Streptomyces sp. DSM 3412]MDT0567863.1 helix-turn-helix domain-containing protein [Streptomyces sp. DSM 3412]
MTTAPSHSGEPDRPADDSTPKGEDLAALLLRLLPETQHTQKELATATGIKYTRLNQWLTGKRGTTRVETDELHRIADALAQWGADVTRKQIFEASGRPVPGRASEEREARLLKIYRALPDAQQRDVVKYAEAMAAVTRVS